VDGTRNKGRPRERWMKITEDQREERGEEEGQWIDTEEWRF
jgi:hypothetical protein